MAGRKESGPSWKRGRRRRRKRKGEGRRSAKGRRRRKWRRGCDAGADSPRTQISQEKKQKRVHIQLCPQERTLKENERVSLKWTSRARMNITHG